MGTSFKKMLTVWNGVINHSKSILELLGFIIPILVPLMITKAWPFTESPDWVQVVGGVVLVVFILGIVVWLSINHFYRKGKMKLDAYIPSFMEQLESISENKYNNICREIETNKRFIDDEILMYDAHGVIRDMLIHIKQLVSLITGVKLSNLSVTFIYKYEGDHWQEIGGNSACTFGELDEMVENNNRQTLFHTLYSGDRNYFFLNNKRDGIGKNYELSIRDGKDIDHLGSIFCRRFFCLSHGRRVVDAMLSISSYNERFSTHGFPLSSKKTEQLLNEAIDRCKWLIRIEMVSMYLRHNYRDWLNVADEMKKQGWLEAEYKKNKEEIAKAVEKFKKHVNQSNERVRYDMVDGEVTGMFKYDLFSGKWKKSKNEGENT